MAESERQEEVAATVAVEIFGVPYSLREDGTVAADRLRVLAEKVDRKMREVADQAPNLEPDQIAILAALNLANEANGDGAADDGRYQDLVERVSSLTSDLEAALDA
ncbi:MAG: cell division protein ZapA [Holophagales bacterium]|nr:cell division protein ZapA [Holophagales bacterium]MXX60203.1 cell division protein ZapA [Holophagales bacterium]MYA08374.1 cell division protein ZapA [Holophagales bacterium]MYC11507.1 cell division protein ZapA [Holophagales bacterium]MYD20789.1 cell division protein ZapA [Holophagales bacterium]